MWKNISQIFFVSSDYDIIKMLTHDIPGKSLPYLQGGMK